MSLKKYNEKRNFNVTKEPIGKIEKSKTFRFFVQHHIARRDHYDFRLEYKGVLLSWAVPKGPSYSSSDKRLAVKVEDHPISYGDFEGIIPEGEYGAGVVMLWDRGVYTPLEDFSKTIKKGYFKFELFGERLKGAWTIVHFKDDNWLLIKENDTIITYQDILEYQTSVKTGRTMEEIKQNKRKKSTVNVKITSPDKILYPKDSITKLQVMKYYQKVAERMLPFLENRILSTVRCPSGVEENPFFKKHFSDNLYLKKVNIPNKEKKMEGFYYIENIEGLLEEVQMNGIEFHVGGSTVKDKTHPNIMVFDLDPDEDLAIEKVQEGVKDLKKLLDSFQIKSFLKTSGGKGYHIVVPIKEKITWKKFETIAKDIATLMEAKYPEKYTTNIRKENRKGKIFIDYLRNRSGATSVVPYSLRVRNKATVSMPIKWSELDKVKPDEITMEEALKRLKRKDPWEGFWITEKG